MERGRRPRRPTSSTGNALTVNIKSDPDVNVVNVEIRQCRADVSFTVADDFSTRTGKCPAGPVSSSADTAVSRNAVQGIIDRIHDPAGMNVLFRVGVGTVNWRENDGRVRAHVRPLESVRTRGPAALQ